MRQQIETHNGLPYWIPTTTWDGRVYQTFGGLLPYLENGTILDFGCSEGITTQEIQELYPSSQVFGIDINSDQIQKAKDKKRKGTFLVEDGYQSSFPDNSFDLVFCMNNVGSAIGFEDEPLCRKLLPEITRLVKPSGHLLFSGMRSYIILEKSQDRFRLKNYAKIYSDIGSLSNISQVLCGQRPKVVPYTDSFKNSINKYDGFGGQKR